jgi:pSer/pThr/pTyr-binding forkhead associated (FHA) protein
MRKQGTSGIAEPRRAAAVDVIDAVLENMRRNLEPLKYSTLAPSRYLVYLHPTEFARLEGIIPILQEQAVQALADELGAINRGSLLQQYSQRFLGAAVSTRPPRVEIAGGTWHIEFLPDPDGELGEGDILVDSELLVPAAPELGAGEQTRRITTISSNQRTTAREHSLRRASSSTPTQAFARLTYDDDAGSHTFDVARDSITIGRGGVTYPVDVRIASSPDVSREHARIRRDANTGQCFLIDLSSLGTTLNGRHVPRGYHEADGNKRENGAETPISDGARIGLADTVHLTFSLVR